MPAAVRVQDFGWRHAGRKNPTLEGLTLSIDQGERVLLLGESGSGKSTLLAAIAGILGDDEGEQAGQVLIDGHPSRSVRGMVGLVLQDPDSQVICSRVGDDVVFGCENLGVPREEMWHRARRALDMVGLPLPFDHPTEHLSGGQKQRLALAGVIAMGAQVIVLDEPTANLDPAGVQDVRDAVAQVAAETGATLIVVEHRVDTWCDVVDRLVVLGTAERGIIADGPPHHVLEHYGQRLADVGVWVPGMDVPIEPLPGVGDAQSALQATQLSVGWDSHTPVGEPRTLHLPLGCSTVITGPNGAGKTTSFYMIVGLIAADAGSVTLDGQELRHLPIHERARLGVGYLPQEASIFRKMTVEQNIRAILEISTKDKSRIDGEVEKLLADLNIGHLRYNPAPSLSGGERRRVEIARVLAMQPRFILLDEPFAGVDPIAVIDIQKIIDFLKSRGIGVLITDHNVRETLSICDRAYIISDGTVLASGKPDDLVNNEQVRSVYLGENFKY